jgi:hypothetical protein
MAGMLIVNSSPRAKVSNSKKYIEIFKSFYSGDVFEYNANTKDPKNALKVIGQSTDMLLVFGLYVDSLPQSLLSWLIELENLTLSRKPVVHVIVNCGFLEPKQNYVAIEMIKLFCSQNGYTFGSSLSIGSGEAILTTPFAGLVKQKISKLRRAIKAQHPVSLKVTMPLTKGIFLSASKGYWINYGAKNNITEQQMRTMLIEDN